MQPAWLSMLLWLAASPALAAAALPGGAQSVSEEHGDWTVACRMEADALQCAISQALADGSTGERVLTIELAVLAADRAEGMLLTPFGLRMADGVLLAVDDRAMGDRRPFLTCIPTGCLVPVAFGSAEIAALQAGGSLTITGAAADTGQAIRLAVSLKGFTAAVNRVVELDP